jgi:succinate-acetate transporter protein
VLYRLSYSPGLNSGLYRRVWRVKMARVAALTQRRALRALFFVLTVAFFLIAFWAGRAGVWPIAIAAVGLGLWLATLARS